MEFKQIEYLSPEYHKMLILRNKILREPLGLVFTEEDLKNDEHQIHLIASFDDSDQVIACCVLTPLNDVTVQLRQMSVDNFFQRKGLGTEMLSFAEAIAAQNGYRYVYLHARKEAVGFYKKNGYTIEGSEFIEVGIPHYEMLKNIE